MANLLIADDEPVMRFVLSETLSEAGHHTTIAADGEEALKILQETTDPFDLVISDVQMPKLDGVGLAKQIHSSSAHALLPVILISGAAREDELKAVLADANTVFLQKPLNYPTLLSKIEQSCGTKA